MNTRRRLERLEAAHSAPHESFATPELDYYLKALENERRKQAGEPPIPLTPEEEHLERERDNDPEFRAYMERVTKQREERLWHEGT